MNSKVKKAFVIVGNTFMYLFFAICLVTLMLSITNKKSGDGATQIFNHEMRIVVSESMEKNDATYNQIKKYKIKSLPLKTAILIELKPTKQKELDKWYGKLKVGDVLTFKYQFSSGFKQETITHRIISIEYNEKEKGYTIVLQGDNVGSDQVVKGDSIITQTINTWEIASSPNYVIGKVVWASHMVGSMIYIVSKPVGIVCVVIVPSVLIIIWEIVKIVTGLTKEKKEKLEKEKEAKDKEIAELRKRLENLEKEKKEE